MGRRRPIPTNTLFLWALIETPLAVLGVASVETALYGIAVLRSNGGSPEIVVYWILFILASFFLGKGLDNAGEVIEVFAVVQIPTAIGVILFLFSGFAPSGMMGSPPPAWAGFSVFYVVLFAFSGLIVAIVGSLLGDEGGKNPGGYWVRPLDPLKVD